VPVTAVQPGASLAGKLSTEAVSHRSPALDGLSIGQGDATERGLNMLGDLSFISETP
jgi:hypothetical protein